MFENSQGNLFESIAETWTPSSVDLPASPPVLPAGEKGQPTIAGSGLTICAWCLKSNPCGCSQRTLAECLASTLTAYGLANGLHHSLRISDTRSSRSCLVLQTLVRRTSESESGLWPTPQAHDCQGVGDAKRVGRYGTKAGGRNLVDEVQLWATPTARDCKSTQASDATHEKNARPLSEQAGQWAKDSISTNGKRRASSSLNPRWELQLMGAIAEWLDIGAEKLSKLWEMRSSLKSRKSSRKPSMNTKGE